MKLILDKNQLNENIEPLLRQAGFMYLNDKNTGNGSFVRHINRGYYPRFHLYLFKENDKIILNLHLDQKQPSYAGAHAHNAEYDGEAVAAEMERIKRLARNAQPETASPINNSGQSAGDNIDLLDKIRPKHFEGIEKKPKTESWWRKLFS